MWPLVATKILSKLGLHSCLLLLPESGGWPMSGPSWLVAGLTEMYGKVPDISRDYQGCIDGCASARFICSRGKALLPTEELSGESHCIEWFPSLLSISPELGPHLHAFSGQHPCRNSSYLISAINAGLAWQCPGHLGMGFRSHGDCEGQPAPCRGSELLAR